MPFDAKVFRVLIASPSDVEEERDIAVQTIQEWNDLNSAERQIVLLPLKWETHSSPEYGKRPQEVINKQVVDHCDLLVGIFWTRVGSPTGKADSGTVEEIERVANANKPVMLYFSKVKEDPDKLDIEQVIKLRDFKKKTIKDALIENYSDLKEFSDKLARQLEIQLRSLIAREFEGSSQVVSIPSVTDIILSFADPDGSDNLGSEIEIKTAFIEIINFAELPDLVEQKTTTLQTLAERGKILFPNIEQTNKIFFPNIEQTNKDYYRQLATYWILQSFFKPVRFWLKNIGGIGARDVHIELEIKSESGPFIV
ncbi:MAG: DUF4062 domain-containing protein, partial [Burkholderiales bacterium]